MPRSVVLLLTAVFSTAVSLGILQPARSAEAHPLGNFSVNRLVIIDIDSQGDVSLRYIVDSAEIPTFQRLAEIDAGDDGVVSALEEAAYLEAAGPDLVDGLVLEIEGSPIALEINASGLELFDGQGGLQTMRTVVDARGELPRGWRAGASASFRDENYKGESGWRQVVVRLGPAVGLFEGEVATSDVTAELTAYPEDLLSSPPTVSEVSFSFGPGATNGAAAAAPQDGTTVSRDAAGKTLGRFASIVSRDALTPGLVLIGLLLAAGWGAMHALGPGHGKTVVAAYLVGERGTWRHAVYLGLIVTATHTLSVFTLGAIALFAASFLSADDVYFWLSVASGGLVALLGGFLLVARLRRLYASRRKFPLPGHPHGHRYIPEHDSHSHEHHDHDGGGHHEHEKEHGHSHAPSGPGWRGLLALGVSGGLVPCPTALVVMLGAIAIDRTIYGVVLVAAFSVGLAAVLTSIGLVMVYGRHLLAGSRLSTLAGSRLVSQVTGLAPVMSALAILGAGLVLTGRAMF